MLVYIAIDAFILYLIRKYYGRRIRIAEGIDKTILLRKRMLWVMQWVTILWVIIWLIEALVELYLFEFRGGKLNVFSFLLCYLLIVGCAVLFYKYLKNKYYVSFVVYRKDEFLSAHPSYVLYLRAFSTDDYNARTNESLSWSEFSEDEFTRSLRGMLPMCAIGMTKEVAAPRGAMRIYVSDTTWQTDVRELMERAELVVILVDDRPSCLWEIYQCSNLLVKTAFIVTDKGKYESVRVKVANNIALPVVRDDVPLPFCVYHPKNDITEDNLAIKLNVFPFKNSLKGYDTAWDCLLEAGLNERRRKKKREGTALRYARMLLSGCTCLVLFLIISALLVFATINFVQGEITKASLAILAIVLLVMYFFWDYIKGRVKRIHHRIDARNE